MRTSYGVMLVIVLLVVIGAVIVLIAQSNPNGTTFQVPTFNTPATVAPKQPTISPTPKYNVSEVIYIAQAKYPVGYKRERIGDDYQTLQTPTSITATYIGGTSAAWKVEVNVPLGYYLQLPGGILTRMTLYFYESDASLRDVYYP